MQISATHPLHIPSYVLRRGPRELGTISKPNNQSTLVVGHLSTLRLETRIHEGMYTYICYRCGDACTGWVCKSNIYYVYTSLTNNTRTWPRPRPRPRHTVRNRELTILKGPKGNTRDREAEWMRSIATPLETWRRNTDGIQDGMGLPERASSPLRWHAANSSITPRGPIEIFLVG